MSNYLLLASKAFLMLLLCGCGLTEDRRFETERLKLVTQINVSLMEARVCQSLPECQRRQIFFLSPRAGGLSLQVWGIEDVDVLKKLLGRCADLFLIEDNLNVISVEIYSLTKSESLELPIWTSAKPIQEFKFERK